MKVLHLADVHLTSRLHRSPREAERADQFLKCLSKAPLEGVELVLIAGDLWDTPFESAELTQRIFSAFESLSVPVVLIAGNHDCACAGSVYRTATFPSNVHFLDAAHPVYRTETYDVYGFSFTAPYENGHLLADFSVEDTEKLNFLLFHGDLVTIGGKTEYMPFTKEELSLCGADYVALGHIHKRTEPMWIGNTVYAYAGIPDGRGFDELGEQGGWLLDIQKGALNAQLYPMSGRQYREQEIDLTGLTHTAACVEKILASLSGSREDAYKLHLYGKPLFPLSVKTLTEQLASQVYFVKCCDACNEQLFLEDYDDYSLVGLYQKKFRERLETAKDEKERQLLERARIAGLTALLGAPQKGVEES